MRWLLLPSSYGLAIWLVLLPVLPFTDVEIDADAAVLLIYVPVCFWVSNVVGRSLAGRIDASLIGAEILPRRVDILLFWASAALGVAGLLLYIVDFSAATGGIMGFFAAFLLNPLEIRGLAQEMTSNGFQLSYLSWVAIFYSAYFLCSPNVELSRLHKICLAAGALFLFALNLLFVDRTRPVTLFVVVGLIALILRLGGIRRPRRAIFYIFVVPVIIFFIQALFTGKYNADDGLFRNFVIYLFGGFGYFSSALHDVNPDYVLTRTLFPISKALDVLGLLSNVPSQILPFRDVPFSTNVGTFVEPLLSDGGWLWLVVGTPILIGLIDYFALKALASRSVVGLFLWANFVLVALLSFFVPKYNSTYLYLFFVVYLIGRIGRVR